jgi:hypothetical protein
MQNSKGSRLPLVLSEWGHWKGGKGGGWSLRRGPPQEVDMPSNKQNLLLRV